MNSSLRTNTLFEQIIREEYSIRKQNVQSNNVLEQSSKLFEPTKQLAASLAYAPKTKSAYNPNYKGDLSKDKLWKDTTTQALLAKKFKAHPLSTGYKPDRYELDVYTFAGGSKYLVDRLTFSPDNTVYSDRYSTKYKWKLAGSSIQITDTSGKPQGKVGLQNNVVSYTIDPEILAKHQAEQDRLKDNKTNFWDRVQEVLQWTGFIEAYGIGMASDLINCIISIFRKQWIDAILSAIAIIPFASAGVKLIKPKLKQIVAIFKGTSKLISKIDPKVLDAIRTADLSTPAGKEIFKKFYAELVRVGILTLDDLNELHDGFMALSKLVDAKLVKKLESVPFLTETQIRFLTNATQKFDDMLINAANGAENRIGEFFTDQYQSILKKTDQANSALLSTSTKVDNVITKIQKADDAIKRSAEKIPFVGKIAGGTFRLPTTLLAKAVAKGFKVGDVVFNKITHIITMNFKYYLFDNPNLITTCIKMLPNPNRIFQSFEDYLLKSFPDTYKNIKHPYEASIFFKSVTRNDANGRAIVTKTKELKSVEELNQIFVLIKTNLKTITNAFESFIDEVGNELIKNNSPIWSLYKNNFAKQLKAMFIAGPKTFGNFIEKTKVRSKYVDFGNIAKWYDIIYNEVKDVYDSIKGDDKHADGIIWQELLLPGLYKGLDALGTKPETLKKAYNNIVEPNVNQYIDYLAPDKMKSQPIYYPSDKLTQDKQSGRLKR